MSQPPSFGFAPLPAGWSEHTAPGGQIYYHNKNTQESTYTRPLPVIPVQPKKKKEKPSVKTPVPGTEWIRVKTTEGNVFYSHKVSKESIWILPDEIKDAVADLELQEAAELIRKEQDEIAREEQQVADLEQERLDEIERVKREVKELVKRKADDSVPLDEIVVSKKAKVQQEEAGEDEDASDEEEEEEWQREAAAQLAAEAQVERRRKNEEAQRAKAEAEVAAAKETEMRLNMPARVDLSPDEAKALFKTLLREKDINPLLPWDTCLPLFVSDPRYVLLPSVSARRDAFDEYCRDRARELRQTNVKKEKEAANPKDEFDRLLREEIKSTRTSWTDFRRAWKKDRRFFGWGRDDREREKRFREYLKNLGETKRAAAQKAEADFFILLRANGPIPPDAKWKDVKRDISSDPRYDAVGSSSLREELFNTFLKANDNAPAPPKIPSDTAMETDPEPLDEEAESRKRQERKERAVREREEKVKAERDRLEVDIGRSRMGLNKEEAERDFRSLLTDAIRDPQTTWDAALPQLNTDPRFNTSGFPLNQQLALFHTHVGQIRAKHLVTLHVLFQSHAPSLATTFSSLPVDDLLDSLPAMKLGLDKNGLEAEFSKWQRERNHAALLEWKEMLSENSFVDFWGRLGKIGGEGVDGGVKADDMEEDVGEGGGGTVDMKELAKSVDVQEIEKVLKGDRRYLRFDHVPEQREKWIREYLSQLSASKLSVHQPMD